MLAPEPRDAAVQVIDVRDLAEWLLRLDEPGTFNAVGPERPIAMEQVLETCRVVCGSDARFIWAPSEWLVEQGVGEWMELPLWLASPEYAGLTTVDGSRAVAAGLRFRPLAATVADTLAWAGGGEAPADPPAGLDRAPRAGAARAFTFGLRSEDAGLTAASDH